MFDPHLVRASHGHVHQVDVITDLLHGNYESVTTVGEVFPNTLVGLGVADRLDGEIVSVDAVTWRIPATGIPELTQPELGLPFAMSASGGTPITLQLAPGTTLEELAKLIEQVIHDAHDSEHPVVAIRIDGDFTDVLLRSEHRQRPPFAHLDQVLRNEVQFPFDTWQGTLVGFSYPKSESTDSDGVTIPGLHLHAISRDRTSGGHVHHVTVAHAAASIWLDDAEVAIPRTRLSHALKLLAQVKDHGAPMQREQATLLLQNLGSPRASAVDFAQAIALHDAYLHDPYLDKSGQASGLERTNMGT